MNEINSSRHSFHHSNEEDVMSYLKGLIVAEDSREHVTSMYFNETGLNITNITKVVDWRDEYKPLLDAYLVILMVIIMLSMGCEITLHHLFDHIKKPVGLCIGIVSQFVVMPASAYCILLITGITGLNATGIIIISCSPGGLLSNTFTYFCEGDIALSIAMTTASTMIAVVMMPFNMWIYGKHFQTDEIVMPYLKMGISLIGVTSPVAVGMLIKWKSPRIAAFITKVGGYCTIVLTLIWVVLQVLLFSDMFVGKTAILYVVVVLLPMIGVSLGYILALVMKQTKPVRKTIAIECGVQNVPVALTVIALSFPFELQEELCSLPWMYGFAMMSGCSIICITYHFYIKCRNTSDLVATEDVEKADPLLGSKQPDKPKNAIKMQNIKPTIALNGKKGTEVHCSI